MNALDVKNLSLSYDGRPALKDLSLSIREGEFFVIIGPNGSGKTTLLKAIAGLIPSESAITILNQPLDRYSRRQLAQCLAVVPQQTPLDFPFTVADAVLMGRSPHLNFLASEQREDYEIAREAMRFTSIDHLAGRRLHQLSGGERQRVIISRAICQQPRIILLDEPTASLDPAHQIHVMDLLLDLRATRKITVVMVSHDLNLAAMYGDRLLLLHHGSAMRSGSPGQVLEKTLLEQAYGCPMLIDEHPLGKVPRVLPIPARFAKHDQD